MDIEPKEKVNITEKLETIDYSHGVPAAAAAAIAGRGWGGEGDQPAMQSVDYNHGQGMVQGVGASGQGDFGGSGGGDGGYLPPANAPPGAYGGFPAYPFPAGSAQPGGFFPQGIDAASLFAAYTEQTGQFSPIQYSTVYTMQYNTIQYNTAILSCVFPRRWRH